LELQPSAIATSDDMRSDAEGIQGWLITSQKTIEKSTPARIATSSDVGRWVDNQRSAIIDPLDQGL
jgi:hypothetical protein